jgi:hypothetical protein
MMTKRILLVFSLLTLPAGGCALVSGSPASSSAAPAPTTYEPMGSPPPSPQVEDVPRLADNEVWVPGYYQPVAGTWIWHQGAVTQERVGYRLVAASYREEGGKIYFTPPRWRRADLTARN